MTKHKAKKKGPAKKHKPLNLSPATPDPRKPETWGAAPGRPAVTPDPVDVMYANDRITGAERNAAMEIARVFRMLSAGLFAKAGSMDAIRGDTPMPTRLVDAYTSRYKPWADALGRQRNAYRDPTHQVVIDAVVDGRSCREIDRSYVWRNGSASLCLRNGLRLYAVMAGWQQTPRFYDKDVA